MTFHALKTSSLPFPERPCQIIELTPFVGFDIPQAVSESKKWRIRGLGAGNPHGIYVVTKRRHRLMGIYFNLWTYLGHRFVLYKNLRAVLVIALARVSFCSDD